MSADSHSKMGVGKKIRRILSFKRKKEEKPAIEAPVKADKTNTLNGTKGKSTSLLSLGRKFSFGSRDKNKKDRSKKGTPPLPESVVPPAVAAPETTAAVPLAAPEVVETVSVAETSEPKIQIVSKPAVQDVEIVSNEIAADQPSESENPVLEKVKTHHKQGDMKDENAGGDGIECFTGQPAASSEGQSDKPVSVSSESEEHFDVLSTASVLADEEPKTTTEVINKIHDKTETNQTGDEFVRTVEVDEERTLAEDGTVISRSTKTTTTTADRGCRVKTEIRNEVLPHVSNGCSRQISQSVWKSRKIPVQMVFAFIAVALACAVLYKLRDVGALSLV